jgi:hypothetical protein
VDAVLKKLFYPVLAALLIAPVIVLCSCGSTVKLTVSNDTHVDMVVKVIVNSETEAKVGHLTPGESAVKPLVESWFNISSISVEGTDSAGRVIYHRDYTLFEAKRVNGMFKIDEQPAYFNIT